MRRMRSTLVLLGVVVCACAKKEEAPAAETAAAAPAALTAAMGAGTWDGKTMTSPGDSVTNTWTSFVAADGSGRLAITGSTDTVSFTSTFDADSSMATSSAYNDPSLPAGSPQVMWTSVGRMVGEGKMAGTVTIHPAAKPDSVVTSLRWESTRRP